MSKRAKELAKQLYSDPKLEDYDDILVYRADRDNAIMGRSNVICVYEQAEKDVWHRIEKYLSNRNPTDYATAGWILKNIEEYKKKIMEEES